MRKQNGNRSSVQRPIWVAAFVALVGVGVFYLFPPSSEVAEDIPYALKTEAEPEIEISSTSASNKEKDGKWQTDLSSLGPNQKTRLLLTISNTQIELLQSLEHDAIKRKLLKEYADIDSRLPLAGVIEKIHPQVFDGEKEPANPEEEAIWKFKRNRKVDRWILQNRPFFPQQSWKFFDQLPRFSFLARDLMLDVFPTNLQVLSDPKSPYSRELFFKLKASFDARYLKILPSFFYLTGDSEIDLKLNQLTFCARSLSSEMQMNFHKKIHQQNIADDTFVLKSFVEFLRNEKIICDFKTPAFEAFEAQLQALQFADGSLPQIFYKGSPILSAPQRNNLPVVLEYIESF